jgi:4-diphosphocytidyl-2-C-methyl-D-erythritol kinase
MVEEAANAKVNLVLAVGPVREDGYHHVVSVLQLLELADGLEVVAEPAPATAITVDAPGLAEPDTLCSRAARDWLAAAEATADVRIRLDKHIPAGAGLGGGSSDAAATLRALERVAPTLGVKPLGRDRLMRVAAGIGSDVPFFLGVTGSGVASGRGEVVIDLPPLPSARFLLLWPRVVQSTGAVYAAYQPRREFMPASAAAHESARNGHWYNDLAGTALALCEPMRRLEAALRAEGAAPMVCGSGSTLAVRLDDPHVDAVLDAEPVIAAATAAIPDLWHAETRTVHPDSASR